MTRYLIHRLIAVTIAAAALWAWGLGDAVSALESRFEDRNNRLQDAVEMSVALDTERAR